MSVAAQVSAQFANALARLDLPGDVAIGLAVSGGGDSVAMMHLAARALPAQRVEVLTVDHGLRAEAADEIALVSAQARRLGLPHHVAKWAWDGSGNLQAAARDGRWAALRGLAKSQGLAQVWMGHTQDDQAETFLMRLARGSGVDGLGAMRVASLRNGMPVVRPLLGISRADLREWLLQAGVVWCDDPSNDDTGFDRIRVRRMADSLASFGLTPKRILRTIDHMQAAQSTLETAASAFGRLHIQQQGGDLVLEAAVFSDMTTDTPRRAFAAALGWVGGTDHRPRFDQMMAVAETLANGRTATLAGCLLTASAEGEVRIQREASQTRPLAIKQDQADVIWDGRWHIKGPLMAGMTVKALGEGITFCPDWRETGYPRMSLMASPSVWQGEVLVAAPVAGLATGWATQIVADFHSSAFAIED